MQAASVRTPRRGQVGHVRPGGKPLGGCHRCGEPIPAWPGKPGRKSQYCSTKCRMTTRLSLESRCEYCGAEFMQPDGSGRPRKTCSAICRRRRKRGGRPTVRAT
jgi:hypothetical protein